MSLVSSKHCGSVQLITGVRFHWQTYRYSMDWVPTPPRSPHQVDKQCDIMAARQCRQYSQQRNTKTKDNSGWQLREGFICTVGYVEKGLKLLPMESQNRSASI